MRVKEESGALPANEKNPRGIDESMAAGPVIIMKPIKELPREI